MEKQLKDYSSISPSAKSLLLAKAYTNIPFAREMAAMMDNSEIFELSFDEKDFWFWIRVMHFEMRYWSIDQLLAQINYTNILELSSGFSFRGPDLCRKNASLHYIDTDLPALIATKQQMLAQLKAEIQVPENYETLPLNVMDERAFKAVVSRFAEGPLSIVNEGLLMYLNTDEKIHLCQTIHQVLKARGGYWITADVYIKRSAALRSEIPQSTGEKTFFDQHNIEENKFESYPAAQEFFRAQGFELVKEAQQDYSTLSVMPQLSKAMPEEIRNSTAAPPKIQATWMLRAI